MTAASCFKGDFLAGNGAVDLGAAVLSAGKGGQRLKGCLAEEAKAVHENKIPAFLIKVKCLSE